MELLTLDLYILLFPPLDIKYVTLNIWLRIMETFQYKCTHAWLRLRAAVSLFTSFDYFAVELPI